MKNIRIFIGKFSFFFGGNISVYMNRHFFVMFYNELGRRRYKKNDALQVWCVFLTPLCEQCEMFTLMTAHARISQSCRIKVWEWWNYLLTCACEQLILVSIVCKKNNKFLQEWPMRAKYMRNENRWSVEVFWARPASFGQLGLISDSQKIHLLNLVLLILTRLLNR